MRLSDAVIIQLDGTMGRTASINIRLTIKTVGVLEIAAAKISSRRIVARDQYLGRQRGVRSACIQTVQNTVRGNRALALSKWRMTMARCGLIKIPMHMPSSTNRDAALNMCPISMWEFDARPKTITRNMRQLSAARFGRLCQLQNRARPAFC